MWATAAALPLAVGAYGLDQIHYADHTEVAAPFEHRTSILVRAHDIQAIAAKQRFLTPSSADLEPVSFSAQANEPTSSEQVQEFRRLSGLTWAQIAEVFEVSPRAPFDWASGKNVSAKNKERLAEALAAMRYADRGSADQNNALLLAEAGDGKTFLGLLRANRIADFKEAAGKGQGRPALGRGLSADAEAYNVPTHFGRAVDAASLVDETYVMPIAEPVLRRVKVRRRKA